MPRELPDNLGCLRDIPYIRGGHPRQVADLFVGPHPAMRTVLLIHGGGWDAMSKEALEPFAHHLASWGLPVFSVNYRLLQHAPWPACLDDVVMAGRYVLDQQLASCGLAHCGKLIVCGASAGGHLAMMAGLALPCQQVAGIISVSGPSRLDDPSGSSDARLFSPEFRRRFFGRSEVTPAAIKAASPLSHVASDSPPLICIHSRADQLVPPCHSAAAVAAWKNVGVPASLFLYDGPGNSHGLWEGHDVETRQLLPSVASLLRAAVDSLPQ